MGFIAWFTTKEIMKCRKDKKRYNAKEIQKRFDDFMGDKSVYDKWLDNVQPRIRKADETYKNYSERSTWGGLKECTLDELVALRNEYEQIQKDMNDIAKIQEPRLTTFSTDKSNIERKLITLNFVIRKKQESE